MTACGVSAAAAAAAVWSGVHAPTLTTNSQLLPPLLLPLLLLLLPQNQVVRTFKPPAGVAAGDVDAAGDGEVLVVMDLVQQEDLIQQGLAREVVNR